MERPVTMENVVIAERVEVTLPLETPGQAPDVVSALHDGDVVRARARKRIRRGRAGEAAPEHDDLRGGHGPGSSNESSSMWNTAGRKSGVMAIWCTVSHTQTVIVVALSLMVSQVPRFQFAWSPVGEYL